MQGLRAVLGLIGLLMIALPQASAETDDLPYFVIRFEAGDSWAEDVAYEAQPDIGDHIDYWKKLYFSEVLLMSGPFEGQAGGMFIIRAKDSSAANQIASADPAVQNGLIRSNVQKWRLMSSALRSQKPTLIDVSPDETFRIERLDPASPLNLKKD